MDFLAKAQTFTRIVEMGSFSAAARASKTSLAAISRQISALEADLGVTLLVRTTRSQQLTDEGRRFHEHATKLVRDAEAARASVRRGGPVAGNFVLSASATLGVLRIVPFVGALKRAHPHLRLELRMEERAVDLVRDGVDLAIRAGLTLPDSGEIVGHSLATFARRLVASPRYLAKHGTPKRVSDLAGRSVVGGLASTSLWKLGDEEVTVDVQLRIGTLLGIREVAIADLGIAILPDFVVADALASGTLKILLPSVPLPTVNVYGVYRIESKGSPRIEALLTHLRRSLPLSSRPNLEPVTGNRKP